MSKTPQQTTYHYGDVVTLTATANAGYTFGVWTGDATGSANPVRITVNGNKTIGATFTPIEYTVAVSAGTGGYGEQSAAADDLSLWRRGNADGDGECGIHL